MLISVVTVSYNSVYTILDTIDSVQSQNYPSVQHVFVDGASRDGTRALIEARMRDSDVLVSEPDEGIYDAMAKSSSLVDGDVVAFLNSDDYYADDSVLDRVAALFSDPDVHFVVGSVVMVDRKGRVSRRWVPGEGPYTIDNFKQFPHPGFFVRRTALDDLPVWFDRTYSISGDLKQQLEIVCKLKLHGVRLDHEVTVMRLGGASTNNIKSYFNGWVESARAFQEVTGKNGIFFVVRKVLSKVF